MTITGKQLFEMAQQAKILADHFEFDEWDDLPLHIQERCEAAVALQTKFKAAYGVALEV